MSKHLIDQDTFESYYKYGEILGEGSFGKVYQGYDKRNKRQIAIKEFISIKKDFDDVFEEFKREWEILTKLNHPHLVKYYDYYHIEKTSKLYLIMEYVKGIQLDKFEKIRKDNLSLLESFKELIGMSEHPNFFWQISIDIFDALTYMHDRDIAHRDVKPANLLIGNYGKITLVDYGLSCFVYKKKNKHLRCPSDDIAGTVLYLSPEIMDEKLRSDKRIVFFTNDVWGAGMSLYEYLFGKSYLDDYYDTLPKKEKEKKLMRYIHDITKPIIKDPKNIYEEYIDYTLIIQYKERPSAFDCWETAREISGL